jgi:hypothetical protein
MELLLSICVGLGLSAACGFRIFVPLLITSIAAHSGHLSLAPSFDWIGSPAALTAFSIATALEVGAYYIPWLDNFLDTVATPAAVVAGTVVTASMVTDVSPFLKWSLAVVAGGGVAGAVQATTVLARGFSLTGTGGLANPLVATAELGGSLLTAVAAILAPLFAIVLVLLLIGIAGYKLLRRRTSKAEPIMTAPAEIA